MFEIKIQFMCWYFTVMKKWILNGLSVSLKAHYLAAFHPNEACSSAYYLLHATFFLGLFFHSEEESNMFLRNANLFSTDYVTLFLRT